jgi:N-acetylneuraminic acid mutarotase
MIRRLMVLTALVSASVAGVAAAVPAYRIEDAMVYDSIGRRHVMFGGYDSHVEFGSAIRFNDIWEYDGATHTWYNVTPASGAMPAGRSGHTLGFDPLRRVVVLFGGWNQTSGYLNDTWEWNCATRRWRQIAASASPSPRQGGRLMYDATGGRMILFAGVDANRFYNETWQFTGSTWTRLTTTSSSSSGGTLNGRAFHGLVYHAGRGSLVIFGGTGYRNGATTVSNFDDMWELRGTTWTDVTPSGTKPATRGWFGMTYEDHSGRIVVYGGWSPGIGYADTWAWNGSTWSQLLASSPPGGRDSFAMTYDVARGRSVVFGGYWSDLWELTGSTWTLVTTSDGAVPPSSVPVSDFDGDGRADLVVFRPSSGQWHLRTSSSGYSFNTASSYTFGTSTDRPVAGDYDGDGQTDLAVWRPSTGEWLIRRSSAGYASSSQWIYQWGLSTDIPVIADFDGDNRTDLVVYRPASGEWYVRSSTTSYSYNYQVYQWGLPGDTPMPGDFDGDGRADLGVYRPSNGYWYIRYSSSNYSYSNWAAYQWGLPGDVPLQADFDGDARGDLAVYRPSTGEWFVRFSSSNFSYSNYAAYQWGLPGDIPLATDFDGDRRTDLVVYRPSDGTWYVRYSSSNYSYSNWSAHPWGLQGDIPVISR